MELAGTSAMCVQRYQPHYLYADGDWSGSDDFLRTKEFLAWLFNVAAVKDEVVVNDRWGNETRGSHGCGRKRSATESYRTANHGARARRVTCEACVIRHAAPRTTLQSDTQPTLRASVGTVLVCRLSALKAFGLVVCTGRPRIHTIFGLRAAARICANTTPTAPSRTIRSQ